MARGWFEGFGRPPRWAVVVMVVGALLLVGGMAVAATRKPVDPVSKADLARMTAAEARAEASQSAAERPHLPAVKDAMALLGQSARPWTLTVVGDSTGATRDRWVYLLAERMSAAYDRPVTLHAWSNDTTGYLPAEQVGTGSGAPIIIWNGSASGKDAEYSLAHLAALAPQPSDLVIVNHGLNMPNALAAGSVGQLAQAIELRWPHPPAMAVTLQNPRFDDRAQAHEQLVAAIAAGFPPSTGVTLIDVHAAFEAHNPASLVSPGDRYHPTIEGDQLWAATVEKALAVPAP